MVKLCRKQMYKGRMGNFEIGKFCSWKMSNCGNTLMAVAPFNNECFIKHMFSLL